MFDWLTRMVGARKAPQPVAAPIGERAPEPAAPPIEKRPPPGQQWIYVTAPDCDVSSIVRSIDGVLKVTRDRSGYWRIAADQDVTALVARGIVTKGGSLTTLISFDSLTELNGRH